MKLYTRTGDEGLTYLYDGKRIPKSSIFFEVLGNLDELGSQIGLLYSYTKDKRLKKIQAKLLNIGSNVAVTQKKKVPQINEDDVSVMEKWIDDCESKNDKLVEFVLSGVEVADSQCHVCRSISRRTERSMWKFNECEEEINGLEMRYINISSDILKYMNRLSDYFFALSRNLSGCKEMKLSELVS